MCFPQRRVSFLVIIALIFLSSATLEPIQSQVCSSCEVSTQTVSTRSDLEANQKDSSKTKNQQRRFLLVIEGSGIEGVRVGKSLLSDVIATYGEDYQLIER